MTKVEAPTLEEAYQKASETLECSISELQCEVVQYPTKGILGFLKKNAIVIATSTITKTKPTKMKTKKVTLPSKKESVISKPIAPIKDRSVKSSFEKNAVMDSFFESDKEVANANDTEESIVYNELALKIENDIKELFAHSCFEIDVVEVDVHDNIALIFIDGDDAALLIGKEGYRYNALSYMLFNWLHSKYELFIKLEIAEFLTKQQEMIKNYMLPVIETAEQTGRAKTRFLDGILVQIALEQLREHFPNKYVAVKTTKDGKKFVVINEFTTKKNG